MQATPGTTCSHRPRATPWPRRRVAAPEATHATCLHLVHRASSTGVGASETGDAWVVIPFREATECKKIGTDIAKTCLSIQRRECQHETSDPPSSRHILPDRWRA